MRKFESDVRPVSEGAARPSERTLHGGAARVVAVADPVGQAATGEGGESAAERGSVGFERGSVGFKRGFVDFGVVSARGGRPADTW